MLSDDDLAKMREEREALDSGACTLAVLSPISLKPGQCAAQSAKSISNPLRVV